MTQQERLLAEVLAGEMRGLDPLGAAARLMELGVVRTGGLKRLAVRRCADALRREGRSATEALAAAAARCCCSPETARNYYYDKTLKHS